MSSCWPAKPLGDVVTFQRGFDLPQRLRKTGSVPIVTSSGAETTHNLAKVSAPGVVTGRYGTIGQVFFVRTDFWPLNTTLYVRDFRGNDPLFISHFLRTIDFHTHSGKSGVPGVNRNDLHEIEVCVPTGRAEQEAIANALSDADALIESLEQLLTKKRQIKQGAMQELLTGKRRLPGFSGEWESRCLRDVADFYKGSGLPKTSLVANGSDECIHYGELFTGHQETISQTTNHTFQFDGCVRSVANDVLMPTSDVTPNGLAVASCIDRSGIILGGDILIIRAPKQVLNGSFLSYVIRNQKEQVLRLVTGSTVFHLYKSDMAQFSFYAPSAPEQEEIVLFLDDLANEISFLENKLSKARQIKQGMMQELLTGRIRLL